MCYKKIKKFSGKPFKSGLLIGTAKRSIQINPYSGKEAFFIKEDQTLVDCE